MRDPARRSTATSPEYDVAVVGGGLVGSALAWGLAQARQRVVLFDEGDLAQRASRGNFGLVWVQGKGLGMSPYGLWTLISAETWGRFAALLREQTGVDVMYERPGGFHLALSEKELEQRAADLARLQEQPGMARYDYQVLDHKAVKELLPEVGPQVAGGTYTRLDGHCNSLKLLRALHAGMRMQGVAHRAATSVESVASVAGGFRVVTRGTETRAAKLVIAAGLGTTRLAAMVGLDIPLRAQRGHIVATERTERFLHYPVATVRQTDEGSLLLGDSQEEGEPESRVDRAVIALIAERAIRMFPRVGALNVVRAWAAQRVMTPDGFPAYDESSTCRGAFAAACHSGVTLAASHALVLAPLIAAGGLPAENFGPFATRRFGVPQAA
jgi:glycine/D-amino acid oxidase-like deaminating enzyme